MMQLMSLFLLSVYCLHCRHSLTANVLLAGVSLGLVTEINQLTTKLQRTQMINLPKSPNCACALLAAGLVVLPMPLSRVISQELTTLFVSYKKQQAQWLNLLKKSISSKSPYLFFEMDF